MEQPEPAPPLVAHDHVTVGMERDHALVLFDWLARSTDAGQPMAFADGAELRALWDLEASLESVLPEVLQDDYAERIAGARDRVRDTDL